MRPRISLVTLGVGDLAASRRFYEALGFVVSAASQGDVVFFQLGGGLGLALFPRALLAADARVPAGGGGFGGITLAHNVASAGEVDAVLLEAVRAGATILKPGQKAFWGGYTGYFADPDGHPWEVAWNPGFAMDASGGLRLP